MRQNKADLALPTSQCDQPEALKKGQQLREFSPIVLFACKLLPRRCAAEEYDSDSKEPAMLGRSTVLKSV